MTELGPALVACLLATSIGAVLLRRLAPSLSCVFLASVVVLALTHPPGLYAVLDVAVAAAPIVAVIDLDRRRPHSTWAVGAAITAAMVLVAVGTDPYRDPTCLIGCATNPLALGHVDSASLVADALVALAALITAIEAVRRRSAIGLASAALTVAALTDLLPPGWVLVAATSVGLVRSTRQILTVVEARGRLADLAIAIEQSQDPTASLRQQLHDPTISLAFVLPDGTVIGQDGHPAPGTPAGDQVELVPLGDSTLARFTGVEQIPAGAGIRGDHARVALDNARLLAVSRLNARLLRASRARVITSSDEDRRLLERDLHDGAQQEVLSLGLVLREHLLGTADQTQRAALERAVNGIPAVLESVRELGHGLRPAGMDGGTLALALEAIADRSPVPVDVTAVPARPLPSWAVSAIAGLVARQVGVANGPLTVTVSVDDRRAGTVITGATGSVPQVEADRFAALGGALTSDEATIHAWLPVGEH